MYYVKTILWHWHRKSFKHLVYMDTLIVYQPIIPLKNTKQVFKILGIYEYE